MNNTSIQLLAKCERPPELEQCIDQDFEHHPDAAIYHSMPALAPLLRAAARRVGDDPA
jgi:hypothetical protein